MLCFGSIGPCGVCVMQCKLLQRIQMAPLPGRVFTSMSVCVKDLCVACEVLRNCFEMNMKYTTRVQVHKLINDIDKFPSQL